MTDSGPSKLPTEQLFAGKKVVLFHVVGAFTPTCSLNHLPSFIEQQDAFFAKGVDRIVCFSTNDPMVMDAWNKQVSGGKEHQVMVLSDGNGEIVRSLGLELDVSGLGLGHRGQRFAMIVDDGIVTDVFVEQDPTVAQVSSAETVLAALSAT